MRFLSSADVTAILTPAICIQLMRLAFIAEAEGTTLQPLRQVMVPPKVSGLLGIMPGYVAGEEALGVKVVSVFPGNHGSGMPSHQGVVLLVDPKDGTPQAILDATAITAIRTAAATAAATDALARKDATTLGIYGYGEQAHQHVLAIAAIRSLSRVVVYGRDVARARSFAARCERLVCCRIEIAAEMAEPAACDIVCTVTASKVPFLETGWLRSGTHVNLVGSATPDASEAFPEIVRSSRFFVDLVESARSLAGEFAQAEAAGVADESDIKGSIGDVLIGRVPGREGPEDKTVFKSLGMAAEDLIAAQYVLKEAGRRGIGLELNLA
jgi:ornithine cyclodeaminase